MALIDLTSLAGDESAAEIEALCGRAVAIGTAADLRLAEPLPPARRALDGSAVRLATVANFPQAATTSRPRPRRPRRPSPRAPTRSTWWRRSRRSSRATSALVGELVEACRAAAGPGITLKLILETGVLRDPDVITAAARAAVMAGVDFLKTSTGKVEVGATLEAAAALLAVIARGRRAGRLQGRGRHPHRGRRRRLSAPRRRDHGRRLGHARAPSASVPPRLLDDLLGRGGGRRSGY